MKKYLWLVITFCSVSFFGCNKDEPGDTPVLPDSVEQIFEGVYINNSPSIQPVSKNEYPKGSSTDEGDFGLTGLSEKSLKSTKTVHPNDDGTRGYDYRFKLVGEYQTLEVLLENGSTVETQATHVKITDNAKYAFVTYNTKGDPCHGGVVVFDVSNIENPRVVSTLMTNSSEFSAVDYDGNKLYAAGATINPAFGYKGGSNPAFVAAFALDNSMKFINEAPAYVMLTSFQGTSLKVTDNNVYVTTGDGTEGTQGGLYVCDKDLKVLNFAAADNARSVDTDANGNVYVMQAETARVSKYDAGNNVFSPIYSNTDEAKQHHAKSEITVWKNYIFAAENESGVRMLVASDGTVNDQLVWPAGSDLENHVTNSVAFNCDRKSYMTEGTTFESNLLLVANGEKGVYWYDVKANKNNVDKIVMCNTNNISFGDKLSANYIASRGNVVFVADGLGGLKILSITVDNGKPDDPEPVDACTDFYTNFYDTKGTYKLFPEGQSVFRSGAADPVKTYFTAENTQYVMKSIKVTGNTNLYISYIHEGAGFKNALAFYVTPEGQNTPEYYKNNINKAGVLYDLVGSTRVIRDEHLILKNISDVSEQGPLSSGQTFQIKNYNTQDGSFNEGDEVVLMLVQNGWSAQNSRVEVTSSTNAWNLPDFLNFDVLRNFLPTTSSLYTSPSVNGNANYTAFKGIQHCAFYTGDCNTIVIAFEDKYNDSDTDYNDIIFTVMDKLDASGGSVMNIEKPYFTMTPEGQLVPTSSIQTP